MSDCSSSDDSVNVTQNLNTFGEELSRKVACQKFWYCLKKYLLQVFFDLKLNSKCGHMYQKKKGSACRVTVKMPFLENVLSSTS